MTFLPIVRRELRVASRRASTYWLRFFAALAVLVVWIVLLVGTRRMTRNRVSETGIFFIFAFWIATGLIVDAVIVTTARRKLAKHFREAATGSYRRISHFGVGLTGVLGGALSL